MQATLKRVILILAALGFVVGLYGIYLRFTEGHRMAAYGSYVPWGLWIAGYVALIGTSAGAVSTAAIIYTLRRTHWYPIARLSLIVAFSSFVAGMFLVWVDLGHAERFWKLLLSTSFSSVMGWMAWFYTCYGLLLLAGIWLTRDGNVPPFMEKYSWLVFCFAVAFAAAEGVLFGVVGAQPLWESGFTPILFLAEGAAFGLGAVLAASYLTGHLDRQKSNWLGGILLVVLLVLVVLEAAEFITGLYASVPEKAHTLEMVLFGPFWWVFWIFHLGLGIGVPFLLLWGERSKPLFAGIAGALVVAMGVSSKLNLIIPALSAPELEGLAEAFSGPGLSLTYFPTIGEWLVFIWAGSLAVLLFLLGTQFLAIEIEPSKEVAQ